MKLFFKRFILFGSAFFILIGAFLILDVFRIFWHYDDYYKGTRVGINRSFVSSMMYKNQKEKYQYDSFIIGNSRSIVYYGNEWKQYLPSESSVFHFDASGGSVTGLYYTVKYIDEQQGHLNNVLVVLDYELLRCTELPGYLFRTSPVLLDYQNLLPFLKEHIRAFVTYDFIVSWLDFQISGEYKYYMQGYINEVELEYIKESNEIRRDRSEYEISQGTYYTEKRLKDFRNWQHPDSVSLPVINDERKVILRKTAEIFRKHNSSLKIVVSPLFDQIKLNQNDLAFLKKTFGEECVYDFSGPNKWNKDYLNYYEQSHYRPCVANDILRIIYN